MFNSFVCDGNFFLRIFPNHSAQESSPAHQKKKRMLCQRGNLFPEFHSLSLFTACFSTKITISIFIPRKKCSGVKVFRYKIQVLAVSKMSWSTETLFFFSVSPFYKTLERSRKFVRDCCSFTMKEGWRGERLIF